MYLIVGLGNPENEYSNTRHNMGFDTINEIAKNNKITITKSKFKGLYETGIIQQQKTILLKPQTYMNLSGEAIKEVTNFYNIEPEKIIVIYDDIDTEKGNIRIRKKGRSRITQWNEISSTRTKHNRIYKNKNWNRSTRIQKRYDKLCTRNKKRSRSSRRNNKKWNR